MLALLTLKRSTSRRYEKAEKESYLNDWWFNFDIGILEKNKEISSVSDRREVEIEIEILVDI